MKSLYHRKNKTGKGKFQGKLSFAKKIRIPSSMHQFRSEP